MKILSISDKIVPFIYSHQVVERFKDIDLLLGCGDLPYYYQEYVLTKLNVPMFFVRGNHAKKVEHSTGIERTAPLGAVDLHRRVIYHRGIILAGVEGSNRYSGEPYQYTQAEMWLHVIRLVSSLLIQKVKHGRFLDIFVTHAPPYGIHDEEDVPHQGIKAFRWLLETFQPAYHFHGHIHVYHPDDEVETRFKNTQVINTFGYRTTDVDINWNVSLKSATDQDRSI